jgi:sulfonate transport system ATP-binding protein
MEAAVFLRGVCKSFSSAGRKGQRAELEVLRELDFTLDYGEFVCIIGRSGCGKSTLLRIIAGLEAAQAGTVIADAHQAISFQEPRLVPWLKVWKNVCLGMKFQNKAEMREAAGAALESVGLAEKAGSWPLTLSGGQAQRVSLARALIRKPKLLLLDEPFGALDAMTRREMQDLLAALAERHGLSVVMVTHDEDEARRLADRILVMEDGKLQ